MADRRTARFFDRLNRRFKKPAEARSLVRHVARETIDSFYIETLERRQMLTTISGGGEGVTISYEFRTGYRDQILQINLRGNIQVELIGVVPNTNIAVDMEAPLPVVTTLAAFIPGVNQLTGTTPDLFAIYIAQSDPNASMTIGRVPERFIANPPPHFVQFTEAGPAIRVNGAVVNPGSGGAYIGGRSRNTQTAAADALPLLSISLPTAFGVRPAPDPNVVGSDILSAGVQTAPAQSIGRFFVAGAITGRVEFNGSVDQFYAGAVLTGDANGIPVNASVTPFLGGPTQAGPNFIVAGDLHQLVTANTIGGEVTATGASYKTGVVIEVGGRVSAIDSPEGFIGTVHVRNDSQSTGTGLAQTEVEAKLGNIPANSPVTYFDPLGGGTGLSDPPSLGDHAPFAPTTNDTTATAQYLGTARSSTLRNGDIIQVTGNIGTADPVDNYAVALMAGQTATAQITALAGGAIGSIALGIIDPDGLLIATDNSNLNPAATNGSAIRFTAKKAGVYYFTATSRGGSAYQLVVSGVGSIALGGLVAQTTIATLDAGSNDFLNPLSDTIRIDRGDLGAVQSETGSVISVAPVYDFVTGAFASTVLPYTVTRGNIRSIQGATVGLLTNEAPNSAPELNVPRGSVGLVRATAGVVAINLGIVSGNSDIFSGASRVGSYQMIDALGNFAGNIATRGGVGTIRANIINSQLFAGRWSLNTDESGNDGILDLVEARASFGTAGAGGPGITTGIGGNIRYIHVGTAGAAPTVFRDTYFGGGLPEATTYLPGTEPSLTDDNGTTFRLASDPIAFDNTIPTAPVQVGAGIWTITTYPIRDKGGIVLIDARLTATDAVTRGIRVVSNKVGRNSSVEIGYLLNSTADAGVTTTYDALTRTFLTNDPIPPATTPLAVTNNITLTGKSPIDVFLLESRQGTGGLSGIRNVENRTTGEIVNINASNIFSLVGESFGFARSTWGGEVSGLLVPQDAFPFQGYHNLINVAGGNIVTASSRGAMGPLFARNLGTITADSDGIRHSGVFEGIIYPLYAISTAAGDANDGNIVSVHLGQGLAPSGTGNVVGGGIYADRQILSVENDGPDSDIRGDIIAQGADLGTILLNPDTTIINTRVENFIENVRVRNGSIINAEIMASTLAASLESSGGAFPVVGRVGDINNPQFDIGNIKVDGNGGIIGSVFVARNIGRVSVNGGFGILNSVFLSRGDGVIDRIETDGYGIQSTSITSGANVNIINVRGNGKRVATTAYDADVRYSESRRADVDPYFGFAPNANTDLHKFLGTTASTPLIRGVSETGIIKNVSIIGGRDLKSVSAHRIIGDNAAGLSFNDPAYPMRITFGQSVGTIKTTDSISGLSLVGGSLNNFAPGNDVYFSRVSITGKIKQINAGGSLRGTSAIAASGPSGSIDSFIVARGLYSPVTVGSDLGLLQVGKDIGTDVNVGGDLRQLSVSGSVLTGSVVNVAGVLSDLGIRRDLQDNAIIRADAIETQKIDGQVLGDIIIA